MIFRKKGPGKTSVYDAANSPNASAIIEAEILFVYLNYRVGGISDSCGEKLK